MNVHTSRPITERHIAALRAEQNAAFRARLFAIRADIALPPKPKSLRQEKVPGSRRHTKQERLQTARKALALTYEQSFKDNRQIVICVLSAVASLYRLSVDELLSESRMRHIVWPRQVAVFIAHRDYDISFSQIAKLFGFCCHSTVIHAVDKISAMERTPDIADLLRDVRALIHDAEVIA